jgi:hypothetical protein
VTLSLARREYRIAKIGLECDGNTTGNKPPKISVPTLWCLAR